MFSRELPAHPAITRAALSHACRKIAFEPDLADDD
jgi:hypothetical protein